MENNLTGFLSKLNTDVDNNLNLINQENKPDIEKFRECCFILFKLNERLKHFIDKYKFNSAEEEIAFFKKVKPLFYAKLIYYNEVYHIEALRPTGSIKNLRHYLNNEVMKLKNYFDENLDFYKYMRTQSTYLDRKYFTRNKQDVNLFYDSQSYDFDLHAATGYGYKVARIIANENLQVFLGTALQALNFSDAQTKSHYHVHKLGWNASKTDLVELVYGLYFSGAIDNSRTDIKQLANTLSEIFDINLSDLYQVFCELKARKKDPVKFLEHMKKSLLHKMQQEL